MNDEIKDKNQTTTRAARYVRFSDEEYKQITEDEKISDKSVQELLKQAYFGKGRVVVLMTDEEKDGLLVQVARIGNNMNQIARKINSGFSEGFNGEIVEVRTMLTSLLSWFSAKYGHHRVSGGST